MNCEIGMVGIGVMGQNLLLNMADHGYAVAAYNRNPDKIKKLQEVANGREIQGNSDLQAFISSLRRPRAVMLLVPAGATVDIVIEDLLPYLETGDLIIDGGNSYFKDTDIRARHLASKGIQFLGVGISGGEAGARHGPSIMPGGPQEAYARIQPVFEAIAAKVNGDACVTYLGTDSVGHFVKMVHNGIEYGIMQLIAETYDLMKRGLHFTEDQLHETYREWNQGELNSYLLEITSNIFSKKDEKTNKPLINSIVAVAKQNGTGMWTSQSAMELQVPIPTIDVAVSLRDLSVFVKEREQATAIYQSAARPILKDQKAFLSHLRDALYAGMLLTYAQGMALLRVASNDYHYHLDLGSVARIWRGGCIIRAALLEKIRDAFRTNPDLSNILLDPNLSQLLISHQDALRRTVSRSAESGIPAPALSASLNYFDAYRSRSPANLIQAQRDYFGAHTYERIDMPGIFHTEWEKK